MSEPDGKKLWQDTLAGPAPTDVRRGGAGGRLQEEDVWHAVCRGTVRRLHSVGKAGCGEKPFAKVRSTRNDGFTLVELLVVIFIMVLLLAMTATAINFSMDAERVRGAARQLQSYLVGARDRAIYAKEPRGVRLLLDENNPHAVSSLIYVAPATPVRAGRIFLQRSNGTTGPYTRVAWKSDESLSSGAPQVSEWWMLRQKGLLRDGARIRIPADGLFYRLIVDGYDPAAAGRPLLYYPDPRGPDGKPGRAGIDDDRDRQVDEDDELGWPGTDDPVVLLTIPFMRENVVQHAGLTYELELAPAVMPNQEPTLLAKNIVIDLDSSRIPRSWQKRGAAGATTYSSAIDILFSPRGCVVGETSGLGLIHLYLCDATVASFFKDVGFRSRQNQRIQVVADSVVEDSNRQVLLFGTSMPEPVAAHLADRLIVTVFTSTGAVSTHPVDGSDADGDGIADDPFRYAESGEVAAR